jgi:hypothetical protein
LYDSRLTNQFLKLIHEIERLQRLRADEDAPWPVAAAPTVQADAEGGRDDVPLGERDCATLPVTEALRENIPPPAVADLDIQADAGKGCAVREQAPAPARERSQDVGGQEANAPMAI